MNLNRRSIFTGIAALGAMVGLGVPAIAAVRPVSLAEVRDILAPGLRQFRTSTISLSILLDHENDALIVMGRKIDLGERFDLGFAITRHAIANGTYKAQFAPSIRRMVELLNMNLSPKIRRMRRFAEFSAIGD